MWFYYKYKIIGVRLVCVTASSIHIQGGGESPQAFLRLFLNLKTRKIRSKMGNLTLEISLNWKLDKWVGSNLLRRALAADSCNNGDGLWVSNRLTKDSIACGDDDDVDDDDRGSRRSKIRKDNFESNMIWVWLRVELKRGGVNCEVNWCFLLLCPTNLNDQQEYYAFVWLCSSRPFVSSWMG